jgi:hypothetical protein
VAWHASGLLFENCSCQLVCPGHIHFTQHCTHERCQGFWAIRFDAGTFGGASLAGQRAVVIYDTPQLMSSGGWTETLFIDAATPEQRAAIESILRGEAGGPWAVLGRFVADWRPTRDVPIEIVDGDTVKSVAIAGWLRGKIEPIRGRDRSRPVRFENIYNQIHAPSQVLARGETEYEGDGLRIVNSGSHGLWSNFAWRVE